MRHIEITLSRTLFAPFHYISSVLVELNDAIVPVTICNEKTSIRSLSDIGWPIKSVWPGAYKTPRTQAQQDTAISIYLSNGVTGLGIVIGGPNIPIWGNPKSVWGRYPVGAAEGVH